MKAYRLHITLVLFAALLAIVAPVWAQSPPEEVNAGSGGFDAVDSTAILQAALDSGARRVRIPYVAAPWITRPLTLHSNTELIIEPGVVVLSKQDEFKGKGDSLFSAVDAENVAVRGYGATLRMRKADYQKPPYEKAEWRMGLAFSGCTNVRIEGLRIESSGGDGIYLGTTARQPYCKDVTIRDVVCHDHHRQGISVIGAENLLIENSTFSNTWGTAPSAGIDLEPDSPQQRLVNIVVRNCVFQDNAGHQILVYGKNLDATAPPVSIRFENCLARQTTFSGVGKNSAGHGWAGISVGAFRDDGPEGQIVFAGCTVEDTGKESVKIYDKSTKVPVRFEQCRFKAPWNVAHPDYSDLRVPLFFEVRRPNLSKHNGNVEFVNCELWDAVARPVAALSPRNSEYGLHDLRGQIRVHTPGAIETWFGPASTGIDLKLDAAPAVSLPLPHVANADAE